MPTSKPKKFNVVGPCDPARHYTLPAFPRLPDVQSLIKDELYFVLHAPRQSGKTTSIYAAVAQINAEGDYYALYCSLEGLRKITDRALAMSLIVGGLNGALLDSGVKALEKVAVSGFLAEARARADFEEYPVGAWFKVLCKWLDKDLVVFFDEADSLTEQPLLSFLAQLRTGYGDRAKVVKVPFPRSIALIGMVNLRDYKAKIRPDSETLGSGSPFNIIAEALTLANFTQEEIKDLYGQHTEATGQVFLDEAVQRAYYWSEGQPWLVNALAREVVEEILRK
ncbi:MAG: ATP-binding protein, partial [Deltaproteobacteria bacterium]|nr:ATP-binding protein [Deltaproteobacteria bacterium]